LKQPTHQTTDCPQLPEKYHFLPPGEKLPVIVATRMSLSFPILLSAIPLYSFKDRNSKPLKLEKEQLQKNWFSDGGICSNFPLHFFDSWLPSRPTFGINLLPNQDSNHSASNSSLDVTLPKADEEENLDWIDLETNLPKFLWQAFLTAQNYRETLQARSPGYKERIVQIRLAKDQGGLNLKMKPSVIEEIMKKGECAGCTLTYGFNFPAHQWVRLQLLLGLIEEKLGGIGEVLNPKKDPEKVNCPEEVDYNDLLTKYQANQVNDEHPYPYSDDEVAKAKICLERMSESAEVWGKKPCLEENLPHPKPDLKITPTF
jgi:hypothetical protein